MRTIDCWNDLEEFGIIPLTGEACGLSMRLLCDVTADGASLIERFLGGTVTITKRSNWNEGREEDFHVGSVMLPRSIFGDLAAFLLYTKSTHSIITLEDGSIHEVDDDMLRRYRGMSMIKRVWRGSTDPGTGDRNEHAMSGRIS